MSNTDLTRWSRKQRREVRQNSGYTIPGRNLPYIKQIHGSLENFNTLRTQELTQDAKTDTQTERIR